MTFGVVTFPGSNCDQDLIYVLETILKQKVVHLWHKDTDLQGAEFILLPGGFSYGDYLRSGAIARFSPIMQSVMEHAAQGGYVMGICNGFQILCESGLLPGALLHNASHKFICKNVFLKPATNNSLVTADLDLNRAYKIPIAHGEGRFYASEEVMNQLRANDQILFRYCTAEGEVTAEANPNGTTDNIAGICNAGRNVFGMMPHPERAADGNLWNQDGLAIFKSILERVPA